MKGNQKEFTKLIRQVRKNGYRVESRGSGHYAISNDDGAVLAILPASASDHRAIKNTIAVLRRQGVDYLPKRGSVGRTKPKGAE